MLVVAMMTYLALQETRACEQRVVDGFLGGLFHDLPEVLTRDITSPVKASVSGLEEFIKEYEREQMEEKLFPLLPQNWHADIKYYTEEEFDNRAIIGGKVVKGLRVEEGDRKYNDTQYRPVDGEIIRGCDHLAAFVEASLSIRHGVTSKHLDEGVERLYGLYRDRVIGRIDFGQTFRAFFPGEKQVR